MMRGNRQKLDDNSRAITGAVGCIAWISGSFYVIYIIQGLTLLLPALFPGIRDVFRWSVPTSSWHLSIILLSAANITHSMLFLSPSNSVLLAILTVGVSSVVEEFGLHYPIIFGDYSFTNELGKPWITASRLPPLVPVLWSCLMYPSLLLAAKIISQQPINQAYRFIEGFGNCSKEGSIRLALCTGVILALYDIVCEPVAFTYGYQLWLHIASAGNTMDNYILKPDWHFAEASWTIYYGLPLQNSLGWVLVGFITVILFTIFRESSNSNRPTKRTPLPLRASSVFQTLPIIVGLGCNQLFYALHPSHPPLVRLAAVAYLICLSVSMLITG